MALTTLLDMYTIVNRSPKIHVLLMFDVLFFAHFWFSIYGGINETVGKNIYDQ